MWIPLAKGKLLICGMFTRFWPIAKSGSNNSHNAISMQTGLQRYASKFHWQIYWIVHEWRQSPNRYHVYSIEMYWVLTTAHCSQQLHLSRPPSRQISSSFRACQGEIKIKQVNHCQCFRAPWSMWIYIYIIFTFSVANLCLLLDNLFQPAFSEHPGLPTWSSWSGIAISLENKRLSRKPSCKVTRWHLKSLRDMSGGKLNVALVCHFRCSNASSKTLCKMKRHMDQTNAHDSFHNQRTLLRIDFKNPPHTTNHSTTPPGFMIQQLEFIGTMNESL